MIRSREPRRLKTIMQAEKNRLPCTCTPSRGKVLGLAGSGLGSVPGTSKAANSPPQNTMGTAAGGFAGPYILGLLKTPDGGYALGMATLSIGPILTASIVLVLGRAAQRKLRAASAT